MKRGEVRWYIFAAPDKRRPVLLLTRESMVRRLENEIDQAQAQLLPLRNFILPGGGELASRLHLARTICRRAERQIVRIACEQSIPPTAIVYLNRLSDWLFVHARLANRQAGIEDIPWRGNR